MSVDVRARLTDGVNRARLELEAKRSVSYVGPLLFAVAVTLVGGALIFSQLTPTLFKSTREVRFEIDDAYGILEAVDDVRYLGVPAGTIQKIEREGPRLVLKTTLRKDFPVYRDARAELRPETPLNDQYLDIIDPGTPDAGRLGDQPLPKARTSTNVKIDQVLNTLGAGERIRLGQLLDNLGNGLHDRGASLRAAISEFAPFVRSAGDITAALAAREAATKRLVHNVGILTRTLGRRERQLRKLILEGSAALGTLNEGSADLDQTLRELPPTMNAVDTSFTALRSVLGDVDLAVTGLKPVADTLPDSLRSISSLNDVLSPAVTGLQRPIGRLVPLARALRPVSRDAGHAVRGLRPQIPTLDKTTRGLVKCEKGVIGFFQWNSSLLKFGDVRGPVPRGALAIGTPDTGALAERRKPGPSCADGPTIGGRPATKADEG